MKNTILQFIKFGIVGASNTLVYLAVYYIVLWVDEDWYLLAGLLGWVISVLNAFFWSNRYVFKNASNTGREQWRRLGRSYLSYGATFLLTQLLLFLEVQHFQMSQWVAPLVNLLVTIPLNFLINKFWTFRR